MIKEKKDKEQGLMASKYPIVLAHGVAIKDFGLFRAFGKIEKNLKKQGYRVYSAKTDGFGRTENNARQLKAFVLEVLEREGAEKVNLIGFSKGGLDSRYMIENLDMSESVASLTTLCTPHGGSALATKLLKLPKFAVRCIEFFLNLLYKILGDERPDALAVGQELSLKERTADEGKNFPQTVHCRSYSATEDELVSKESAAFGDYRGHCLNEPLKHLGISDCTVFNKKKRERVYGFYLTLCEELTALGF